MENTYKIIRSRDESLTGKFFLETEDDNLISPDSNSENGEPFCGSWTDSEEEYASDDSIQILVSITEVLTLSGIRDIELYFSATPETITEEMREKIEEETMYLEITLDHDNHTATWCFCEGNNTAWTSWEDDYDGVVDFFEDLEKEISSDEKFADMMNENQNIPESAIDEFEKNPEETIKKYESLKHKYEKDLEMENHSITAYIRQNAKKLNSAKAASLYAFWHIIINNKTGKMSIIEFHPLTQSLAFNLYIVASYYSKKAAEADFLSVYEKLIEKPVPVKA